MTYKLRGKKLNAAVTSNEDELARYDDTNNMENEKVDQEDLLLTQASMTSAPNRSKTSKSRKDAAIASVLKNPMPSTLSTASIGGVSNHGSSSSKRKDPPNHRDHHDNTKCTGDADETEKDFATPKSKSKPRTNGDGTVENLDHVTAAHAAAPDAAPAVDAGVGAEDEEIDDDDSIQTEILEMLSYVDRIHIDHIEDEQEKIFAIREKRAVHYAAMKHFWSMYTQRDQLYGRLYTRTLFAEILFLACSVPPYGDNNRDLNEPTDVEKSRYMVLWRESLWDDLIDLLHRARAASIRNDSSLLITNLKDPNQKPDPSNRKEFKKQNTDINDLVVKLEEKFEKIILICVVNKALAPIRLLLESQIQLDEANDNAESTFNIDPSLVANLFDVANSSEEEEVRVFLQQFFITSSAEDETRGKLQPSFRPIKKVAEILLEKPFDLDWVQKHLEFLIQQWVYYFYGKDEIYFKQLNYRWPVFEENSVTDEDMLSDSNDRPLFQDREKAQLRASLTPRDILILRRNRKTLANKHGADPINESLVTAQQALASISNVARKPPSNDSVNNDDDDTVDERRDDNGRPKSLPSKKRNREEYDKEERQQEGGSMYEKKKSAKALEFTDDIEESGEDESINETTGGAVKLPKLRRVYNLVPSKWDPSLPTPDEDVFDETGRVVHRRKWTAEEKVAIKDGVNRFGTNWVAIKRHYANVLRNRTNVQCKDCYRTLVRTGEI